jgi:hypothetical protein
MMRLEEYQSALLVLRDEVADDKLASELESRGELYARFIIDHGLGPLWHERTGREEFRESRLSSEALYLAQERALQEIDALFDKKGIEYTLIKGSAIRLLVYENPALRACFDLDLLVRPEDRVRAATVLVEAGFSAQPDEKSISRELVLSRGVVDVDLHWALLREGRLRTDPTEDMIRRRRRSSGVWMLNENDTLFLLLVHGAFAKHLAGWDMGLHRVLDVARWLEMQSYDWQAVLAELDRNSVRGAGWATLRWVELLAGVSVPDIKLGGLRKAWLNTWLKNDWSGRLSGRNWARLVAFSPFLHDSPADVIRAFNGRQQAKRRIGADLEAFRALLG